MRSIWEEELLPRATDVTIVGAGFSGLWTAFFLRQKNARLRIQIIDQESIATGASTRNAGFACFGSVGELLMNRETMGESKTLHWASERFRGIRHIVNFFGHSVAYTKCGGLELFTSQAEFEKCEAARPAINVACSEFTGRRETFEIADEVIKNAGFKGFKYAIRNNEEGGINSGLLLNALQHYLVANNVQLHRGIGYTAHEEHSEYVQVRTTHGTFDTQHLCFATNAFSPAQFSISPGRGQVIVTEPLGKISFDGTFHVDKGFTYFRNVGNRVLIGGGRNLDLDQENTAEPLLTQPIQQYLEGLLRSHILPNQEFKISHRWAGIMGFTENHEPVCEVLNPHTSIIAGMNGMGVALAPRLAEILADKITQQVFYC